MAISDRAQEALEKLIVNDYENAMVQTVIAIDGTAKKRYSSKLKPGARFRKFVEDNEEFILYITLSCGPRLILRGRQRPKFLDRGSLARIIYKYVRNALLHQGDVSDDIVFCQGPVLGHEEGKFIVSSELIVGMLLSVIGDPVNASQRLRVNMRMEVCGQTISVNSTWGQIDSVKAKVGFK